MKKIILLSGFSLLALSFNGVMAQDDVYDAPRPKQAKTKQSYTMPEQQEKIIPVEKTQSYNEDERSNSIMQQDVYTRENRNYSDDNDYSEDSYLGYSDRIRRFHNPSFQFSYGWNNWNSNYYNPWNSYYNDYGWNNWNNYSFTPSWTYGYNNFYNPFWGNTQIILLQPGFSSWYNTGFCSPFNSWNNYYSWYGFSPYCSNTIYNYGYNNYEGYYDHHKKNIIYTPRTGGYNNTNNIIKGNNPNYNYNNPTNNGSGFSNGSNNNNQQQVAPTKKWNNKTTPTPNNNNDNVYKYNQPSNNNNNNNWNNNSRPEPTNIPRENNSNPGNSGIKVGTRPK